ncbi:hypothetical protein SAMN05421759_11144 [Roseivivax lentus]|uniref:Uncharacterized protein n=1 Tax=Roseivivax lentus TaxID=633194 RepID=A0A1N7NYY0_9RHOB|nr:hypothetical protein [Roseivivax lentus]SIT03496.1 hypothetical protein SAMN05421759_11144 [Roseivivax lentus]
MPEDKMTEGHADTAHSVIAVKRLQPVPARPTEGPLPACDCDEYCNIDICGIDDVEAEACGVYGG